jgi:hypothetical protein
MCVWRTSTRRDADDNIMFRNFFRFQISSRLLSIVFASFQRLSNGFGATRHDGLNPARGRAESGRTFCRIKHCNSRACSRADVEDAATIPYGINREFDGSGDFRNRRSYGCGDLSVFGINDFQYPFGWQQVDVDGSRITPFGAHAIRLFYFAS